MPMIESEYTLSGPNTTGLIYDNQRAIWKLGDGVKSIFAGFRVKSLVSSATILTTQLRMKLVTANDPGFLGVSGSLPVGFGKYLAYSGGSPAYLDITPGNVGSVGNFALSDQGGYGPPVTLTSAALVTDPDFFGAYLIPVIDAQSPAGTWTVTIGVSMMVKG